MVIERLKMQRRIRTFSKNTSQVSKRREEIVDCAIALFIKNGYDRTSMRELADAFGKTKGGIYHYIGSKEDILYLILTETAQNNENIIKETWERIKNLQPIEAIKATIRLHLKAVDENQDRYIFINHVIVNLSKEQRQLWLNSGKTNVKFLENVMEWGVKEGSFEIDDPHFLAHIINTCCVDWAIRRWSLRINYTLEEYTDRIIKTILSLITKTDTSQ